MFLNEINIEAFRVLEDITVRFQTPESETANPENGNVINVIAGVNGTGKTSLLDAIYHLFIPRLEPDGLSSGLKRAIDRTSNNPSALFRELTVSNRYFTIDDPIWSTYKQKYKTQKTSKVIFLTSQQSSQYEEESNLKRSTSFLNTIDSQKIIGRAEYYIKDFVLGKERTSNLADPKKRSEQAVDAFNEIFEDANLLTKLSDLSPELFNRPIFENAAGKTVTIDQLSDGEKQLYGRLIALMILDPQDSIILIDEPENALHPAWQQIIMKLYSQVGKNNQFIVATHSPQVIASVPYQNRIILHKEDGKIVPIHCDEPPSGVDVNSILSEIMFAEPRDLKLLELYKEYRQLVEDQKESSERAKEIKSELGKKESQNSEFMQEMQFFIELREV